MHCKFCRFHTGLSINNISNTFKLVKLFRLFAFPALLQAISHVVNDGRVSGVSLTSSFNGNLSLGDGRCRIVGCSCFVLFLEQASGCGGCGEAWEGRLAKPGQRATTVLSSRYQTIQLFFLPLTLISAHMGPEDPSNRTCPYFARDKWSDHDLENCSEVRRVTRVRKMLVPSQILRQ